MGGARMKCAFLYGLMRSHTYIGLPRLNPRYGDGRITGELKKAMHSTRNAPQMGGAMKVQMVGMGGGQARVLHPLVFWYRERGTTAVAHATE